ncbi:RrF2 family transcriptional regulator [Nitrincola alkalilacustris]|uniref:RrF2 family transcriptional regulator n=1 Tax=Nitrincola alkalilacustris TaxID=1571224 RepID=UPI00124E8D7C|nr:Rrf2 family transcriptional regulator [Nitrincola alkalilacustris]
MQITIYTDYSLRVLTHLALQPGGKLMTIQEIADSYQISKNHLTKVVHHLQKSGYIDTIRGKKGGIRLRRSPSEINIGALVRETEQDMKLVECFSDKGQCAISPACHLKSVFDEALKSFLATLDRYTLADTLPEADRPQLIRLLGIDTSAA